LFSAESADGLANADGIQMRRNKTAEGEADMAEAVKMAPHIAATFSARGLSP
jgi:hypothetical protein